MTASIPGPLSNLAFQVAISPRATQGTALTTQVPPPTVGSGGTTDQNANPVRATPIDGNTTTPAAPPANRVTTTGENGIEEESRQPLSPNGGETGPEPTSNSEGNTEATENGIDANPTELTDQELLEIQELRVQDRTVRQHELAHLAAGGQFISGGPTYSYTVGPDGRQYATSGEVSIDTSKGATPEQSLIKAQIIRRAALAPAQPSGQDRAVAAQAAQLEAQARREISQQDLEVQETPTEVTDPPPDIDPRPNDFEFTEIGPGEEDERDSSTINDHRTPITALPIPLPPESQSDVGQIIDFIG